MRYREYCGDCRLLKNNFCKKFNIPRHYTQEAAKEKCFKGKKVDKKYKYNPEQQVNLK